MADLKNKFEYAKDKVAAKTKEVVGKALGNKERKIIGKLASHTRG